MLQFSKLTFLCITALLASLTYGQNEPTANCITNDNIMEKANQKTNLYHGQQEFAINLLGAIQNATPNENIFFSPYSTYHALLLAYFGANGDSLKELESALHLSWAKDKSYVAAGYRLEKHKRASRSKNMPLEFASADKIFYDETINFSSCMKDLFFDELEAMDFQKKSEESRITINNWIANLTRNEIKDMLKAGDVSSDTQMVLANAAYFKAKWASQFDAKDTSQQVFYTSPTKQQFVEMMHKRGTYNLAIDERLGAYVLEMPYQTSDDESKESEISMIIMLPPDHKDSVENVLSKLTPDSIEAALKDSMAREIDISLPKFEFEQNIELIPVLRQLGINSIFDHNADLTAYSTDTKLSFGDAKHFSKIKVDEEGSTAASATVLFSFRSARPVEPTEFKCDHPFLFLIFDHTSKAILFTGIYRDPKTQK